MKQALAVERGMSMGFSYNLSKVMAAMGLDQSALSRLLGVSPQAVNQWVKGATLPNSKRMIQLAETLKVPLSDLYEGQPSAVTDVAGRASSTDQSVLVPELEANPQAGAGGADPTLDMDGKHIVLAEWAIPLGMLGPYVSSAKWLRIVTVRGDSMAPEYNPNDKVLVDTSQTAPSPAGVYVLWDGFGLVLKRIALIMGPEKATLRLSSNNPLYPTYDCLLSDVSISGRVVAKWEWK